MSALVRTALCLALPALLAACGSQPPRPASGPEATTQTRSPSPAAPPSAERRGGYYLDDGPGDNPPANLDTIPDAEPRPEALHRFANNPYSVFGRDYVPATGLKPYKARGIASWYGKRFHGQKTSSGEPYDMYAMTAAHPTLPIPSYARVTNVANGKSVVVRVNDRGPFHSNRIIDLSYTAAHKLGYIANGSTLVEVESVVADDIMIAAAAGSKGAAGKATGAPNAAPVGAAPAPVAALPVAEAGGAANADPIAGFANDASASQKSADSAAAPVRHYLQLGAFSTSELAESFRARVLRELGSVAEKLLVIAGDGKFRLHLGPYATKQEATSIADRVREALKVQPMVIQR